MKEQEAIKGLKELYPKTCKMVNGRYKGGFDDHDCMEGQAIDMAIEALEKQVPKKPRIVSEKEIPKTHNLGRLLQFHCPRCGKFIVGTYETDPERGGGIHERLKGCSTCLQAIDFSGYYHKGQLDEDIEWSDTDD